MSPRVAVLGGGIGAGRIVPALARALAPGDLTCIVNTADDHWRYGLRICPDLDTNLYALAGLVSRTRGWGLEGDSFRAMERLCQLGEKPWFGLGDLDLATHLLRTEWIRAGRSLTEVTTELAQRMGVETRLLPMTDASVETRVLTSTGERSLEEYLVRDAARETVVVAEYRGVEDATPAPGVLQALADADTIVLAPSNPITSLGPILAIPRLREAVHDSSARVVGVTPVVTHVPIIDPGEQRRATCRRAMLAARGLSHTASAVAGLFADVLDAFVVDRADFLEERDSISELGIETLNAPTLVAADPAAADHLAGVLVDAKGA